LPFGLYFYFFSSAYLYKSGQCRGRFIRSRSQEISLNVVDTILAMWQLNYRSLSLFLLSFMLALMAAEAFVFLRAPLPWMTGPLFVIAAARLMHAPLHCPVMVREAGQWAIGAALGLYFTADVIAVLYLYFGFIAAAVIFALLLGVAGAWLLHKLSGISGVSRRTAFFAMAIGGASEMATQGERHGAAVEQIAAAHSLRIMLVVAIIPFAFKFLDVHGLDPYVPAARTVNYSGLVLLVLLTVMAALVLKRLGWPNAWVIGPLLMSIALTASDIRLSAMPEWAIHLGQLFIGLSLGVRFTPAFLRSAPRYMGSVAVCSLLALLISACFGLMLAKLSGMQAATSILATSPGGIAEMSLTAKNLELGVPIVTAFHVARMAVLVLTIGPLFRLLKKIC
jgi:membrane AbrB-like protein